MVISREEEKWWQRGINYEKDFWKKKRESKLIKAKKVWKKGKWTLSRQGVIGGPGNVNHTQKITVLHRL